MRALQKELDELRRDKERDGRRAREDEEELRLLREQCERLENEQSGGADPDIIDQLRTDNLTTHLRSATVEERRWTYE